MVIDPFLGSGTVGQVCERLGRQWFGIELNPGYEPLIRERTAQLGLFAGAPPPSSKEDPTDEQDDPGCAVG